MNKRPFRLPPLNSLKTFLAVIKQGSFRGAAELLHVSPQAVRQQIKLLEEMLSIPLFERKGRMVEPNESARTLARFIEAGFDEFAEGIQRVTRSHHRQRIHVNVSPYFATNYLVERMTSMRSSLPNSDIHISTLINEPDFAIDGVDVSIQWGFGDWHDYKYTLLVRDPKVICCAPHIAQSISTPADLLNHELIHTSMARHLWRRILDYLGVTSTPKQHDMEFQDAATMRRVTVAGTGVGLLSYEDAVEEINLGRLVAPLGINALIGMDDNDIPGFYLLMPKAHMRVEAIAEFYRWMSAQAWKQETPDTESTSVLS